jgi:hypothetical protein
MSGCGFLTAVCFVRAFLIALYIDGIRFGYHLPRPGASVSLAFPALFFSA